MFVGTPCQVEGLLYYLGKKEKEHLLTVDLVCYGVPSPGLYKEWIQDIAQKHGSKVSRVYFRDKKYGYAGVNIKVMLQNGQALEDIVDVRSGRDYKHLVDGNIPVYGTGGYMLSVNAALSYDENAVGIGRKGTIDKPYILYAPFWTVDTLFYAVPRKNNDLNFIYNLFQQVDWRKKDESTGVPSLSKVAINSIDINTAGNTEQQIIGVFFENLDDIIVKIDKQINKLKNIKKACLDKMFVTGED
mgnify:CR=1 FL=1